MDKKFAHWSPENATKAYLKTLKMGVKRAKEPDVSEFISALAAGNNAQVMVVASGEVITTITLQALVAAAYQTGGRVICIFHALDELHATKQSLNQYEDHIEYVVGDAKKLILKDYKEADFVLVDCKQNQRENILREMEGNMKSKECMVIGINAFSAWSPKGSGCGFRTELLPIGDGLLVTRVGVVDGKGLRRCLGGGSEGRKSHWVVKVDRLTGEEHVFRIECLIGNAMGM